MRWKPLENDLLNRDRDMYENFYGFNEKPFTLLPDPSFLYMTKAHSMALTMLEYSLNNDSAGICVISGEIGSGKTTLIRKLLNDMDNRFTTGLLTNTHKQHDDLLKWITMTFGLDYKIEDKVELYDQFVKFCIEQYSHGKRVLVIIDEAQNLSQRALEELRMLSNINADKNQVLQLILIGQPELRSTLKVERLEQLNQRVTVSYHLAELNQHDSISYIRHRLQTAGGNPQLFDDSACKAIWFHSRGIPRVINTLCDTALVYAFAEQKSSIDVNLINEVVSDRKSSGFFSRDDEPMDNVTHLNSDDTKKKKVGNN